MKLLLIVLAIGLFGLFSFYNRKILDLMDKAVSKSEGVFYRYFGRHIRNLNMRYDRTSALTASSRISAIDRRCKEIIINLDLTRNGVTTVGLLVFMASIGAIAAVFCFVFFGNFVLSLVLGGVIFYLVFVIFDFMSLMRFERKESDVMDAEDLIAMDVKGGVQNAITRYKDSFNPRVRPYFIGFLDDIQASHSFEAAMRNLNEKLGVQFDDFTQKAIMYEKDADKDMEDIFSTVIEMNRFRRGIRQENNVKFNEMRLSFIIALGITGVLAGYLIFTEPFIRSILFDKLWGQLLLVADVLIIAGVLAYLSKIKARL